MSRLSDDFKIFKHIATTILVIVAAYTFLLWIPISLGNEATCLSKGYPDSTTTVYMQGYCISMSKVIIL